MDGRGPVDRADDRNLDGEQVDQEALAVGVDGVPLLWRHRSDPARIQVGDEAVTGAGEDDDPVLRVAADVGEAISQLGVRSFAPHEGASVGVQSYFEDPVDRSEE